MKHSLDQKLFLQINQQVGKRKWLDFIMVFCAKWLIYVLAVIVLSWAIVFLQPEWFKLYIKLLLSTIVCGVLFSLIQALIWRHTRPIVCLPRIKLLFNTMETWKTFPSDHTLIAFSLVFITFFMGASWCLFFFLLCLALLVGIGRVYSGVHYPKDVLGGICFAAVFSFLSYWLVVFVTQPMYNFIINLF